MASVSLSIPIAFWASDVALDSVSYVTTCMEYIVAGFVDGHIGIFRCENKHLDAESTVALHACSLLVGHSSRVTAITCIPLEGEPNSAPEWAIISASNDGEVKKWSLSDGRCLQSNANAFIGVPSYLCVVLPPDKSSSGQSLILCTGQSNEACILDSASLEVVRVWGGHQNWIHCTPISGGDQHHLRILSVSPESKLTLWTLDTTSLAITKTKSFDQCIPTQGRVLSFVLCEEDMSTVAIVTNQVVQVIHIDGLQVDAGYLIPCPESSFFAGASFLSCTDIALWTQSGQVHVYSIPDPHSRGANTSVSPVQEFSLFDCQSGSEPKPIEDDCHRVMSLIFSHSLVVVRDGDIQHCLSLHLHGSGLYCSSHRLLGDREKPLQGLVGKGSAICSPVQWFSGSDTLLPPSQVTSSVMVDDSTVAIGLGNGETWILGIDEAIYYLSNGFSPSSTARAKILKGHIGPITTVFASNELTERSFILTGGQDCSARIWSTETCSEVACFINHCRPISFFMQVPEDVNSRVRRGIISVAEDNSVAILSIEEMSCLYLFAGYESTIISIQWRPQEDYVVLCYSDDTAFVWQIQTGHLDRIVQGSKAQVIMSDERFNTCKISHARAPTLVFPFDCFTVAMAGTSNIPVLLVHTKQVLSKLSLTRSQNQQDSQDLPKEQNLKGRSSTFNKAGPTSRPQPSAPSSKSTTKNEDSNETRVQPYLRAAKAILSVLLEEENTQTHFIRNILDLSRPPPTSSIGVRGVHGSFSLLSSSAPEVGMSWIISSTMTALKLVAIISISKAIASLKGVSADVDIWAKEYCGTLQDTIGSKFCGPSLSFLVKFWQDPQVEIQDAAKTIILSSIQRMSSAELASLVQYWSAYLPAVIHSDLNCSQYMARSAIILGIIGAENAGALPERARKLVALSLTILLNDDSRVSYKLSSIDLLAQGLLAWQPYIRADAVLRTLFGLAMDSTQANNSLISRRARRAIAQIATLNGPLFVTTLSQEIHDAKRPSDRAGLLKLISVFSRKNPQVLYCGAAKLAEAIVKSLDPTTPSFREQLLPIGTSVMMDLVHSFPQLDFHVGSQKLAAGTSEGAVIVYDLHTATRWQILEGHSKAVSAVSFSRDGRTIVSCSISDGTVRFWHPSPGFFAMIMGGNGLWGQRQQAPAPNQGPAGSMSSLSSQQSIRVFEFAIQTSSTAEPQDLLRDQIHFEWTGDRAVKLTVLDHVMSFNV